MPDARLQPRFDTSKPVQGCVGPAQETATIFVGGSRSIERIPDGVEPRLARIVQHGHLVIVGDALGVDQAVQAHLTAARYAKVTVFCSGGRPRNNIGNWPVSKIDASGASNGFRFHAAKDRAMAERAGFGLMLWDGRSPGTVLNVVRLIQAGRSTVLCNVPEPAVTTLRSADDLQALLARIGSKLRRELLARATADERRGMPALI